MIPGETKTGEDGRSEGGRYVPGGPLLPEERWMAVEALRPNTPRTRATPHGRGSRAKQEVGGA